MSNGDTMFDGQAVLVTGSGHGLGRSCALQLARAGARVIVSDIRDPQPVVDDIRAAGGEAVAVTASVIDEEGVQSMIDTALASFGRLDGVINNAGIFGQADIETLATEEFLRMVDVHLVGSFRVARAAWPYLRASDTARLVNISSGAGFYGLPRMLAYSAAKSGIVGLTHALALEGAADGILVNSVSPAAQTGDSDTGQLRTANSSALLAPLGERAAPEWATPIMAHLVSPQCTVTGHVYAAGGGRYSRILTVEAPGWSAGGDNPPTPAEVATAFAAIDDTGDAVVVTSMAESMALFRRLEV